MRAYNSGCLLAVFTAIFGKATTSKAQDFADEDVIDAEIIEHLPYKVRDDFLSAAETSFLRALQQAIGDRTVICPKVRLGDILFCAGGSNFWRHTNRVNQKHVDFLVCQGETLKPLFAIELDDHSHQRERVKERDTFKDAAFEAAGLPLVRIVNQRAWNTTDLKTRLASYLEPTQPIVYLTPAEAPVPTCVKCGVPMVLRTAKRGKAAGEQFYGCTNYPRCREVHTLS